MREKEEKPRKKAKILRWRGVLDASPSYMRWMVAIVLAVAGGALTFTQLGFVDVELPDGTVGYVVVLLQVAALGALLLGTLPGTVLGLVTGGVLLLHARFLPLDHYELTFVTPLTSIVMFGVCGFLLGILFAFVLRKKPGQVKRVIYIAIVCGIVSFLYSLGFAFNVFMALAVDIFNELGPNASESEASLMASRIAMQLGDMGVQARGTAFVMALLCSVGDYLARRIQAHEGSLGLRTVFGAWLAVTVGLVSMVMSALGFASISADELHDAEKQMSREANYLCIQFEYFGKRNNVTNEVLTAMGVDSDKIPESLYDKMGDSFFDDTLLNGYKVESEGAIIVSYENYIYATNDTRYQLGDSIEEAVGPELLEAANKSIETEQMQRFVYDEASTGASQQDKAVKGIARPHIAYLFAKKFDSKDATGADLDQAIIVMQPSSKVFENRGYAMTWMALSSLALLLVVFVIVSQLLNRVVARRIDEENSVLARITAGELNTRAEAGGTHEFDSLSEGINHTVDALRGWISEAETRMDAELATAKAIQESALPRIFPPFPGVRRFDIYAIMTAAREVGGDFYDFFLIGDSGPDVGKLGFVIADVSGKGVPAALFMMKAKTQIRDYLESGMEVGEAVENANRQLVEGNDAGMFVTAWVGVLDYATGHVDYVNAGHNPPLLWQREGGWQWMRKKSGPILGLFDMPYRAHSVECQAGDTFLLYTDGVTEAFDVDENLYGEERLLAVAEKGFRLHPRELLEAVRADVSAYAQGAERSDDITILALEVGVPPEITATLEVPARVEELTRVNDFLHGELERRLCPLRAQNQLDIAVEELFVNVCNYAYPNASPDAPGTVRIQRTYAADPASITVDIIDEGVPYNPLEKPDAVTPDNIEDVPIGGLGILMAKRCTDEMRYERTDNCNVVTIVKRW